MKRTYQPKKKKRMRVVGFLERKENHKKILKNRRKKGRIRLTPSLTRKASK
jgi:large subunit ribosomal protein L34